VSFEWLRENVVIVSGSCGPVRAVTHRQQGPAIRTCANGGYVAARANGIGCTLDLDPPRSALPEIP
jgi:hypothetical protein